MNITTLSKMQKMHLYGMYRAFKTNLESENKSSQTSDEIVAELILSEWEDRQNRAIERQLKNARFRYRAAIEDVFYDDTRNFDKNQIMRFA